MSSRSLDAKSHRTDAPETAEFEVEVTLRTAVDAACARARACGRQARWNFENRIMQETTGTNPILSDESAKLPLCPQRVPVTRRAISCRARGETCGCDS